jgi:hypothetical protein
MVPPTPLNGLHESRTPAHSKAKALDILISHQNEAASALNHIKLPKIHSTRAADISSLNILNPPSRAERNIRRSENQDPIIYMTRGVESKITSPKNLLAPIIEKYNHQNSEPITPLMQRDLINQSNQAALDIISEASRISPIRQNYMQ